MGIADAVPQACTRAEGDSDREASLVPEAWDQGFGGRQYGSVAGGREREASHVSALVPWAALLSSVETTPSSCRAGTEEEL